MFLNYNNASNLSKMNCLLYSQQHLIKSPTQVPKLLDLDLRAVRSQMSKGLNNGFCNLLS